MNDITTKYNNFIFDLDNTIYKETDYLFQVYKKIASYLSKKHKTSEKEIYLFLKNTFLQEGRTKLFEKLFEKYNINEDINNILNIMRTCSCRQNIKIFPQVETLLKNIISGNKKVFILTNGNVIQQKNKIKHIEWKNLHKDIKIYYANEIKPKPSSAGVEHIIKENKLHHNDTIFIGDSDTDKLCAENSKIKFININNLIRNI